MMVSCLDRLARSNDFTIRQADICKRLSHPLVILPFRRGSDGRPAETVSSKRQPCLVVAK